MPPAGSLTPATSPAKLSENRCEAPSRACEWKDPLLPTPRELGAGTRSGPETGPSSAGGVRGRRRRAALRRLGGHDAGDLGPVRRGGQAPSGLVVVDLVERPRRGPAGEHLHRAGVD